MKLPRRLQEMADDMTADRAPSFLLYAWPNGRAVDCPTLAVAQSAATRLAGEHPGLMVAVYALVGFAHQPMREPEFTPAERREGSPQDAETIEADVEQVLRAAEPEPTA